MFYPYLKDGWNFEWNLIHFNVGLHDLKYIANKKLNKKEGILVSSLEEYESNLRDIIHYLKSTYPKAKLVLQQQHQYPKENQGELLVML